MTPAKHKSVPSTPDSTPAPTCSLEATWSTVTNSPAKSTSVSIRLFSSEQKSCPVAVGSSICFAVQPQSPREGSGPHCTGCCTDSAQSQRANPLNLLWSTGEEKRQLGGVDRPLGGSRQYHPHKGQQLGHTSSPCLAKPLCRDKHEAPDFAFKQGLEGKLWL